MFNLFINVLGSDGKNLTDLMPDPKCNGSAFCFAMANSSKNSGIISLIIFHGLAERLKLVLLLTI